MLSEKYNKLMALVVVAVVTAAVVWVFVASWTVKLSGPMVQMLEEDSFTLVWFYDAGGQKAEVTLKPEAAEGTDVQRFMVTPTDEQYLTEVEGLQPDTLYVYSICLAGTEAGEPPLATGEVHTAPADTSGFRFMAFGDGGWGSSEQYELAKGMPGYNPRLVVHTGDLIYMEGAAGDYYEKFYKPYKNLLTSAAFYPCIGNHDWDTYQAVPMYDNFVLPENGPQGAHPERHYWFDYGNVRFVAFDSNATFTELRDQVAPWLDQVLAGAKEKWKVVFYHHPYYSNAKHDPAGKIRQLIIPLFDRHQVDLVFRGHNHIYERTFPIYEDEVVEPGLGTVYMTTGAAGAPLYPAGENVPEYMAVQKDMVYSFTVLEVEGERITGQQIGMENEVLDEFTIFRNTGTPASTQPMEIQPAEGTAAAP